MTHFLRQAGTMVVGWDNTHVAHFANGAPRGDGWSPCMAPLSDDCKLVVGTFSRGGHRRVVIANDSFTANTQILVQPRSPWQLLGVVASIEAKRLQESEDQQRWQLAAGDCVVIEMTR